MGAVTAGGCVGWEDGEIDQLTIFAERKKGSFMHVSSKKGSKESTGLILMKAITSEVGVRKRWGSLLSELSSSCVVSSSNC